MTIVKNKNAIIFIELNSKKFHFGLSQPRNSDYFVHHKYVKK